MSAFYSVPAFRPLGEEATNSLDEMLDDEPSRRFFALLGHYLATRVIEDECVLDAMEIGILGDERPNAWRELSISCQSPIERLLLAHLLFENDGYAHGFFRLDDTPPYRTPVTTIRTQGEIGPFKADFLITTRWLTLTAEIVIECDGHNFHERTKEQAAHDKARDRYMTKRGIMVLRYTGSEVYRDPAQCSREIAEVVQNETDRLEKEARAHGVIGPAVVT